MQELPDTHLERRPRGHHVGEAPVCPGRELRRHQAHLHRGLRGPRLLGCGLLAAPLPRLVQIDTAQYFVLRGRSVGRSPKPYPVYIAVCSAALFFCSRLLRRRVDA